MRITVAAIALLLVTSCNYQKGNEQKLENDMMHSAPMERSNEDNVAFSTPEIESDQVETNIKLQDKKVIYNGSMDLGTEKIEESKSYIDKILDKHGCYYENEELEDNVEETNYQLKIRIPNENFRKFINDLEKGSYSILKKSIQAEDVTEEYRDIAIRIENKKAYLERYKKLLGNANSIKSILEIEEIIRNLEEEIESREGRMRYLDDQARYSSLSIVLTQKKQNILAEPSEPGFAHKLKNALVRGWHFVVNVVLFFARVWPFTLVMLLVCFVLRKRIQRLYHRVKELVQ